MSPARLRAGLCTQTLFNPLLDERFSGVREEPEFERTFSHMRKFNLGPPCLSDKVQFCCGGVPPERKRNHNFYRCQLRSLLKLCQRPRFGEFTTLFST